MQSSTASVAADSIIAANLSVPWDIAWLPSGDMLVTERPGNLTRIGKDRVQHPVNGVRHTGEAGLMGMALHPNFARNHWIYLMLTTQANGTLTNRVERYTYENDQLTDRVEILANISGAIYHDGGRLEFGPDGLLYITTGDATKENLAQDTSSLAGKILRLRDDGSIPSDNPFGTAVYSYGHRNPQGLAWDDQGRLWSTEHGRSGVLSGYDEFNQIRSGANYGWPVIQGNEAEEEMVMPVLHSGSSDTWAPASAVFLNGSVFFGGLRGEALYEAVLTDDGRATFKTHLKNVYGRIRTVRVGPDGFLYLTTSNTDGRGRGAADDDKIVRVDPASLATR